MTTMRVEGLGDLGQLSSDETAQVPRFDRSYYGRVEYLEQVVIDACEDGVDPYFWTDARPDSADVNNAVTQMLRGHADGLDGNECICRFKEAMDKPIKAYANERIDGIDTETLSELEREYGIEPPEGR